MKVLLCPDKFKGSLDARGVCRALEEGVRQVYPHADVKSSPMADGGEGTCALLTDIHHGQVVEMKVTGPLFTPVTARYGISGDGQMAFIEMAEASGLTLLRPEERNPMLTTSFGTGELIADAIRRKVQKIILGIGGSATNDAGIGMAAALGFSFCDKSGEVLKPIGENLIHIHHIKHHQVNPELKNISITTLCDVTNPLYGPDGAAFVYGPQKGGTASHLQLLDAGLRNFRRIVHKQLKISVDFPGAGAAGGLGAGARVFLSASIQRGIAFMIESTSLRQQIADADLVITGEGKIDRQTLSGKVVSEVIRLASEVGKPVIAVCGKSELSVEDVRLLGISQLVSLVDKATSEEFAMKNTARLLTEKIASSFRERTKE